MDLTQKDIQLKQLVPLHMLKDTKVRHTVMVLPMLARMPKEDLLSHIMDSTFKVDIMLKMKIALMLISLVVALPLLVKIFILLIGMAMLCLLVH
jgi:hypothetical protein